MGLSGPRPATAEEVGRVLALVNAVFRSGQAGNVMGESYPHLFHEENLENLRVFFREERCVSHVGVRYWDVVAAGVRFPVAHVGAVCTEPAERGQGLATRLMEDAMAKLRRDGAAVCSISGGRGLYRRLGAHPVGRAFAVTLPRPVAGSISLPDHAEAVRRSWSALEEPLLDKLARLYQHQLPRYGRPRDAWSMLLRGQARRAEPERELEGWLLFSRSPGERRLAAYALVAVPAGDGPGRREAPPEELPAAWVVECAGEQGAVARLLRWGAGELAGPLTVRFTRHDDPLLTSFQVQGAAVEARQLGGTVVVVDAPGAVAAVAPALRERWPGQALAALRRVAAADDAGARTAVLHLLFGIADQAVVEETHAILTAQEPELAECEAVVPRLELPLPSGLHYV